MRHTNPSKGVGYNEMYTTNVHASRHFVRYSLIERPSLYSQTRCVVVATVAMMMTAARLVEVALR